MKISLFYKTIATGAVFSFLVATFLLVSPTQASAGFFSDLIDNLTGNASTQSASADSAPDINSSTDDKSYNSQTIPLLETTTTPGAKIKNDTPATTIVEDQALSVNDSVGIDSDINPYISTGDEKIDAYKVKNGDTISKIAKKFGISENTIIFANPDIKNSSLKVGQTLVILPVDGVTIEVKKGDTLSLIAKKYKASVADIADFNNIDKTKGLKVGDSIIVPGGTIPKPIAVAKPVPEITSQPTPTQISSPEPTETIQAPSTKEISNGYIWPLPIGVGRISQRLHADRAVDIAAPKGSPIYSIASGTVLIADGAGYNGGYGLYVVINFDNGAQAIFGHMSKVLVTSGQTVNQGDVIGLVGSTGHSTGSHIHLGIRGGFPNPFEKLPMNAKDYQPND